MVILLTDCTWPLPRWAARALPRARVHTLTGEDVAKGPPAPGDFCLPPRRNACTHRGPRYMPRRLVQGACGARSSVCARKRVTSGVRRFAHAQAAEHKAKGNEFFKAEKYAEVSAAAEGGAGVGCACALQPAATHHAARGSHSYVVEIARGGVDAATMQCVRCHG